VIYYYYCKIQSSSNAENEKEEKKIYSDKNLQNRWAREYVIAIPYILHYISTTTIVGMRVALMERIVLLNSSLILWGVDQSITEAS